MFVATAPAARGSGWLQRFGIFLVLGLLLIASALLSPAFLTGSNLVSLGRTAAVLTILAVGQTFVMLGGGIDLSVGAVMAMATMVSADVTGGADLKVLTAVLVVMAISALVGVANGLLVTLRNIPPFVGTLGMLVLLDGARLAYTKGVPSGSIPPVLQALGKGSVAGIPNAALIAVAAAAVAWVVLHFGTFGRSLYATGANPVAAELSGVPVNRVRIATYVISSLLAGVAGILLSGYIGYVDRYIGRGFELDSIAAVAVGGVSLAGGAGSVAGSVAGVLLVTVLVNLVTLLNLNTNLQLVIKGLVIIGAVSLYSIRRRS